MSELTKPGDWLVRKKGLRCLKILRVFGGGQRYETASRYGVRVRVSAADAAASGYVVQSTAPPWPHVANVERAALCITERAAAVRARFNHKRRNDE